jgi:hypothetical protein
VAPSLACALLDVSRLLWGAICFCAEIAAERKAVYGGGILSEYFGEHLGGDLAQIFRSAMSQKAPNVERKGQTYL